MERNCSAPGAFGISIMSKSLVRWKGEGEDSRRGWKLFREISPRGHTQLRIYHSRLLTVVGGTLLFHGLSL